MALRSGAGTGVVVSLVVFILTTVFLLVLTIVFYAGQRKAIDEQTTAQAQLATYVDRGQLNREDVKAVVSMAEQARQSVYGYQQNQFTELMTYVGGDPSAHLESIKSRIGGLGVDQAKTMLENLQTLQSRVRNQENELDATRGKLQQREAEIGQLEAQQETMREAHREQITEGLAQIDDLSDAAQQFETELTEAIDRMSHSQDEMRQTYEGRISSLQSDVDNLVQSKVLLENRIRQYESILNEIRVKAQRPETLVDGKIIDTVGGDNQVFIDRGRQHRIVLGMTFEVYDDPAAIRINPRTGEIARGKASLQVIKVGDTTSTCKITRSVPGRPVVRGNVITNAIYDPTYQFKFFVHGMFDVDGDGKPTKAEAEYLESLVTKWGGTVVYGEDLPGDLDFLVLGVEPPMPQPVPHNATQVQINVFIKRRLAHERYNDLKRQAMEAQIPVLNANRFFILTGHVVR